jgi:TonB family protein
MRREESLELASNLVDQTLIACLDAEARVGVLAPLVVAQNALRSQLGGHPHATMTIAQPIAAIEHSVGVGDQRPLVQQSHSWLRETRALIGAFSAFAASPNLWTISPHRDHGHTARDVSWLDSAWSFPSANDSAEHRTIARVAVSAGSHRANLKEGNVSEHHPHGASTIRASKGGGGGSKWLIGGVAAVVLVGGGYAAWKTLSPAEQQTAEIAYDDPYAEDQVRAGPLDAEEDALADTASTDENVAPPATSERRATPRAQRAAARAAPVPEETIGITPVSASTDDTQQSDEVIVRAPQRPVWARTPSERRLTSSYPTLALRRGSEGEARLSCTVLDGGALGCERLEETSATFGAAAMRVARSYRHAPTRADGSDAVGTPVNLRVVFRMEEEERGQRYASR